MALFSFFSKRKREEKAEMSFIDHIEVLRGHIVRSLVAIIVGAIVVGIYNEFIIQRVILGPTKPDFITYKVFCQLSQQLGLGDALCMQQIAVSFQSTAPAGQFSTFFSIVFIGGFVIAFPYVFWEFWRFIKPALTKKELHKTRGVIFWVSLLFFLGIGFGYFVIAPYTVNFFANFTLDPMVKNDWNVISYIDLLTPLILGTGLAFQMPLVMFFLAKVGIVSSSFLKNARKYAIVIILIVAAFITPPDMISQIIVTIPLLILYEISIWLTRRVEKEKKKLEEQEWS